MFIGSAPSLLLNLVYLAYHLRRYLYYSSRLASLPPPTDTTSEYARIYARHSESALYHAICYVAGLFDLFLIMFLPQEIRDVVERARLLGFAAEDDSSWMAFIKHLYLGSQGTVIRRTGVWIVVIVRISSLAFFGIGVVNTLWDFVESFGVWIIVLLEVWINFVIGWCNSISPSYFNSVIQLDHLA